MKTPKRILNRQGELGAISILMLRHMEINLAPIDRIVFLRLLICYGGRKILITDLKFLAKEVKVNWLTLKKSLGVLVEKGLCEQLEEKVIQLNKELLPRQVGYRWRWKPFSRQSIFFEKKEENSQRVDELTKDQLVPFSIKNNEIKKAASRLVARYPRHDFLEILFGLMFDVKISHKQKNADELLELNYKQWLVLVNMVLSSDSNGIVFNTGTHELSKWTGMSRNALQRAIADLFDMGILRSKLDGTLNNNLLNSVTPVYCLNLSADIWGQKRIFGHYYFLKFPNEYTSVVDQAFNFIQTLIKDQQTDEKANYTNIVIRELEKISTEEKSYRLIGRPINEAIREEFNFVIQFEKGFGQYIQLITPSFHMGNSSLNTQSVNLSRIIFMLTYIIQSNILRFSYNVEAWQTVPMPVDAMAWFKKYLTEITVLEGDVVITRKNTQERAVYVPKKPIVEESRGKILFAISQAILRSEMIPILKDNIGLERIQQSNITLLPSLNTEHCDRVYFCRYTVEELKQKMEQDAFHMLEFEQISVDPVEYALNRKELKLSLEDQKKYGLFNPKNNNKS